MESLDRVIEYYDKTKGNGDKDEALIRVDLKHIRDLQWCIENPEDFIFITKIIDTFCEVVETQKEMIESLRGYIDELSSDLTHYMGNTQNVHNYMGNKVTSTEELPWDPDAFESDAQLQEEFAKYCIANGKSSYTVNDYCSRVRKLWKVFLEDYLEDDLPGDLRRQDVFIDEDEIDYENPLLNIFRFTAPLLKYIDKKIKASDGDRNLANARAALKKFDKFKNPNKNKKK